MAGSCSTTARAVLALLALSTSGCAERILANVSEHVADVSDHELDGHFLQYQKLFEVWPKWAEINRPDQESKFSKVLALSSVREEMLRNSFESIKEGVDIASKDCHVAIAAEMWDILEKPDAQVLDLGCGTGALMAIFMEAISTNCAGCKVEGLDYDNDVVEQAQSMLPMVQEWGFQDEQKGERIEQVSWNVDQGDALQWNQDGAHNGRYHAVSVGFAVSPNTLAGMKWTAALALGGKLMVPVCKDDVNSKAFSQPEPMQAGIYTRCPAKFHIFTKTGQDTVAEDVLDRPIRFICVGPDCDAFK